MELIELFGYFGALIVGLILGLIGGGGSILTVPILVYILNFSPIVATAYSLFVVGSTATIGTIKNLKTKAIDFKTAVIFAIPSIVSIYFTRSVIIPNLPKIIFSSEAFKLSNALFIMLLFAFIMVVSGLSMVSSKHKIDKPKTTSYHTTLYILIIFLAIAIGILAGLVGAGGGFLIVPALVLLLKMPIKKAVSTSLFIIAIQSFTGFLGDINHIDIDWYFLLKFTSLSILGIFIGLTLAKRISPQKMKKGFGYFTIIMGVYIIYRELF
ncbi:MAG: sulfite exporter TauE/SafE family protein [Winogradskyella sp.]